MGRDDLSSEVREAVEAHQLELVRRFAVVLGDVDAAQDVTQETFARAMTQWARQRPDDPRRWLLTVGMRLAIDEHRRRRRWGFFPLDTIEPQWALDADPDLWAAIATLDRRSRAALLLTVIDGYTQDEAAQMLGVRRGTVASLLSRARARLKPALEVVA